MIQVQQIQNLNNQKTCFFPLLKKHLNQFEANDSLPSSIFFEAKNSQFYAYQVQGSTYFFIGLGEKDSYAELQKVARTFSEREKKTLAGNEFTLVFPNDWNHEQIESFVLGLFLGCYQIRKPDLNKPIKHPLWVENNTLSLYQKDTKLDLEKIANKAQTIAEAQFTCMDWLNKAPNQKNSEIIGDFAQNLAQKYGFDCTVLNREESEKAKLHAFLSVNQGSAHDAAFTILEYKGKGATQKMGIVGKCVTFDTGGISIKPSQNMHHMKSDMGGATAVLGTFQAAAALKLPIHLIGILPATDNAVDQNSYLPGDVISSHSGKTIEVLNTDAEGRMTLADGLSYMVKEYNPDILIDLATLTGSSVRTFGHACASLLTNNTSLEKIIRDSGDKIGQRSWPLPLWDYYLEDLKSDIADFRHLANHSMSDVIHAAKFLEQFTHKHNNWAHLDIAGVAYGKNNYAKDESATGFGVQLLLEVIERIVSS